MVRSFHMNQTEEVFLKYRHFGGRLPKGNCNAMTDIFNLKKAG